MNSVASGVAASTRVGLGRVTVMSPIVIVASMTALPDSVDTVREVCMKAVEAVHPEPGCELYALHEGERTFVFIEQWADEEALQAHSGGPAVAALFSGVSGHLDGKPDIKMLKPVLSGDRAKGLLWG